MRNTDSLHLINVHQQGLFPDLARSRSPLVIDAVESLATEGGAEERGAIFTSPQVVESILDLCRYTADRDLLRVRLLEPSFGDGDFLIPIIERLLQSLRERNLNPENVLPELNESIRAVELHRSTFVTTREKLRVLLASAGIQRQSVETLLTSWLTNDDFLLADVEGPFDLVVGNPPYVRQERLPTPLLKAYRERFATFVHRADLYVAFYEKGLGLLASDGALGYICANRWVRNQYGGELRNLIGSGFHLEYFVDLERARAFKSDVIAYPAITVIRRADAGPTLLATGGSDSSSSLAEIVSALRAPPSESNPAASHIESVSVVSRSREPWLIESPAVVAQLRALEGEFPTIEQAGSRVGIGVATGADKVFIAPYDELPVEEARKLPLAKAGDCRDGRVQWSGLGVINPYLETGELASFGDFPEFGRYLNANEEHLKRRHVAKKRPNAWYKTIDRIYPSLLSKEKLLVPDIKGDAAVCYEPGELYPHHNLYVVTSSEWDLTALMAVLRSSVALAFVAAYSPRMAGGFLRFQAQYLRRIRCPRWRALSSGTQADLVEAGLDSELEQRDAAVFRAFGMSSKQARVITEYAETVRVVGAPT